VSSDAPIDLSVLNDTERDILRLLAEGHTAKSIATHTDRSVNSVNERLRDARRKTGAGSSRELARLLREQENRDEQIGVADGAEPSPDRPEAPGTPARRIAKGTIMALATLAALAAVALSVADHGRHAPSDQTIGSQAGSSGFTPESLRARLLAESRDAAWADAAEAALRARYATVETVARGEALRDTCGSTLCEVAGRSEPGATRGALARLVEALQSPPVIDRLDSVKLDVAAHSFRSDQSGKSVVFAAYWTRDRD
jgi:DNA-binding CsgD family transcriptional regulator